MVGRDIGTVVLPEAELKVYLDASVNERARRRFEELRERGGLPQDEDAQAVFTEILESMRRRDRLDSTRRTSPLRPARDAIILDSDQLDADQVLEKVKELVRGDGVNR
jgi:cytidylate kinase